MYRFLFTECLRKKLDRPPYFDEWLDVRILFHEVLKTRRKLNVEKMLNFLGMEFDGNPHCGLDDAKNIGRILQLLRKKGAPIRPMFSVHTLQRIVYL